MAGAQADSVVPSSCLLFFNSNNNVISLLSVIELGSLVEKETEPVPKWTTDRNGIALA
jgi:hypothetical protein